MLRRDVPLSRELYERAHWLKDTVLIAIETEMDRIARRSGFVMPSERDRRVQNAERQGKIIALGPLCDREQLHIDDHCWFLRFVEGQDWESQNYKIEGHGQCIAVSQGNVVAVER